MEKVKAWLRPPASPGDRLPFVVGHEAHASSSDFPRAYAPPYATFTTIGDHKLPRHGENFLFWSTISSFGAALLLLMVAGILAITGKHRLQIEVDTGIIVGIMASIIFGSLGLSMMLVHREQISWAHKICVGVAFVAICVLNGMLLVVVTGNTDL
jgi:heme/copper-type cytochrome/quinol oxidase subunit 4